MNIRAFNRDLVTAGIALAATLGAISAIWWDVEVALGIALTTPVAIGWLYATAVAVHRMVSDPELRKEGATPQGGGGWKLAAKLPLVALALTFILWYMPARPEGVVLGVLNGLLAAVYAAFRHRSRASD